ncbi:MAG TPA: hypothetical protein VMY42_16895 [Thermoguttaceae bacterium]|nr:hypothetical protein [Thermoguttaceae bacterium]
MRLTLRTMLAYMDGILEPEDAEEIGKKIEESEYATDLLHRTQDVMRRLRLAAPALGDRGPGLDANTVAEYLDNTLHADRVPDFEKVCLESDVHLAEVASCHQILTLVLGEAAEIDPASRQRMYQLPDLQAARAATSTVAAAPETVSGDGKAVDEPAKKVRQKPAIPDYLREPRKPRRFLPAAVALVSAVCFAAVVLGVFGQFQPGTPLGDVLVKMGIVEAGDQLAALPEEPAEEKTPAEEPTSKTSISPEEPPLIVMPPPDLPPEPDDSTPVAPLPDVPGPGVADPIEPPIEPPVEPPVGPPVDPPVVNVDPVVGPPVEPPVEPVPPAPLEPMGGLISSKQVLLRFDAEAEQGVGTWQRVPTEGQGILSSQETLLSLPTFRPVIALTSTGATIELIDGTQIELLSTDPDGVRGVKVAYGQLLLRAVGKPNVRLKLQAGRRTGVITLGSAESVAALHVGRGQLEGLDPEVEPAAFVTDLYAVSGEILWDQAGYDTVALKVNTVLALDEPPDPPEPLTLVPAPVEKLPEWISGDELDIMHPDRVASYQLERELQADAGLGLIELANHRRKEVAWLSARCLGYLGRFDPMVVVLNDPLQKQIWPECIEKLREAVAREPRTAAAVRQAVERRHDQEAPALYRMLWGYTETDLRNGQAAVLIDHLNHKTLAVRVVSYWNLEELTGWKLYYVPEDTEAKRKPAVQKWKERLDSGEFWTRLAEKRSGVSKPEAPVPEAMPR